MTLLIGSVAGTTRAWAAPTAKHVVSATAAGIRLSPPGWWLTQARCIHRHESIDWHYGPSRHRGYATWNGYYGGYQFTLSTWRSADRLLGRRDDPQWSSPWVQTLHAYVIWLSNGRAWGHGQWPTSSVERSQVRA